MLGHATNNATILELKRGTIYSIEVAEVNSAGTGKYSTPIIAVTNGKFIV